MKILTTTRSLLIEPRLGSNSPAQLEVDKVKLGIFKANVAIHELEQVKWVK